MSTTLSVRLAAVDLSVCHGSFKPPMEIEEEIELGRSSWKWEIYAGQAGEIYGEIYGYLMEDRTFSRSFLLAIVKDMGDLWRSKCS